LKVVEKSLHQAAFFLVDYLRDDLRVFRRIPRFEEFFHLPVLREVEKLGGQVYHGLTDPGNVTDAAVRGELKLEVRFFTTGKVGVNVAVDDA
jgi:hypothetical protein